MENTQSCCWWVQISTWHRNMGGIAIIAYQIHGTYQWKTVSTRTSSEQKAIQWIQEHIHLTGYNPKLLRKNLNRMSWVCCFSFVVGRHEFCDFLWRRCKMNAATKIVGAACNRILLFKTECGNGGKWARSSDSWIWSVWQRRNFNETWRQA